MTEFDFKDCNGPVPAKKHSNGGGWVADTATVADSAYVGPDARVFGDAEVSGNARVSDNARVSGYAKVFGNALVSGDLTETTSKEELDGQVMEIAGKKYKLVEVA